MFNVIENVGTHKIQSPSKINIQINAMQDSKTLVDVVPTQIFEWLIASIKYILKRALQWIVHWTELDSAVTFLQYSHTDVWLMYPFMHAYK